MKKHYKFLITLLMIHTFIIHATHHKQDQTAVQLMLPTQFIDVDQNPQKTYYFINPIFFIFILDFHKLPSKNKDILQIALEFAKNISLPKDFFKKNNHENQEIMKMIFDWENKESLLDHKNHAEKLGSGIRSLSKQFPHSSIIIITHQQGSILCNIASHNIIKPIKNVIQITPFIPSQYTKKTIELFPDKKTILQLTTFYTQHTIISSHDKDKSNDNFYQYDNIPNDTRQILLLINNKQPLSFEIINSSQIQKKINNHLLSIAQSAHTFTHKNLIAHLTTSSNQEHKKTDTLILVNNNKKETPYVKHINKKEKKKHTLESGISKIQQSQFEKIWKKSIETSINTTQKNQGEIKSIKFLY